MTTEMKPQTTTTTTTGNDDIKCTCCDPANILIKNPQLGEDSMICPNSGHIYQDRGDGVWGDTGKTLEQFLAEQNKPKPKGGGTTVIDPNAGGDRPAGDAQTGTKVNLRDQAFSGGGC